jgi:maleate isomerase
MNYMDKSVQSREWPTRFDEGRHPRARLGFVLIATERLLEDEMFRLAPPDVGIHFSRARNPREIDVASLASMIDHLAEAASLIMPGEAPDVVCYACTSGSVVMGEDNVIAELERGSPGATATTLLSGVIAGLRALEAKRIVIATPYLDEVNAIEAEYMTRLGFDVLDIQGLNLTYDEEIIKVAPEFLVEFATAVDRQGADAIFISCGALRSCEVIDQIEQATGKPVVTSNQGMLWHCLRLAGIDDKLGGLGRLFREF